MFRLETKVKSLNRVGHAIAKQAQKLGIETVGDLLYFFPFRYEDYNAVSSIASLQVDEYVRVPVTIEMIASKTSKRKRMKMTEAIVSDGDESLKVVWFNQPYISKKLKVGDRIILSGKLSQTAYGMQFNNPEFEQVKHEKPSSDEIVPVYSTTGNITQKQLRYMVEQSLPSIELIEEWLPKDVITKYNLIGVHQALHDIHQPPSAEALEEARQRLQFDELFLILLQAVRIKELLKKHESVTQEFKEGEIKSFVEHLPFTLTNDQKKAAWQIFQDIAKDQPMNRLLEGDVGSGKTIVAALGLYHTTLHNQQGVLMAPTTILARQHYATFLELFENTDITVGLMTTSERKVHGQDMSKDEMLGGLQSGELDMVIGTHALLSDPVYYANLGMVVIDEQHRFGVEQRKTLKQKNLSHTMPHLLSMTATPIPRSLALVVYGDLDVSVLKEKPGEKKPIVTRVVNESNRREAYTFIRHEVKKGRQVFVICPLIDPSDKLGVKSVTEEYEKLNQEIFPHLNVGMLHGKLKPAEKEEIMKQFKDNEMQVLVSTSVIEVGIDIPNATIMMIEGAERFGLAQLHQFRGRVGRGEDQSHCFVFPTGSVGEQTMQRLQALEQTNDGFKLAEYDLQIRGPGEIYGTRQSGLPEVKLADITDTRMLAQVQEAIEFFFDNHNLKDHPKLHRMVEEKTEEVHLE